MVWLLLEFIKPQLLGSLQATDVVQVQPVYFQKEVMKYDQETDPSDIIFKCSC